MLPISFANANYTAGYWPGVLSSEMQYKVHLRVDEVTYRHSFIMRPSETEHLHHEHPDHGHSVPATGLFLLLYPDRQLNGDGAPQGCPSRVPLP